MNSNLKSKVSLPLLIIVILLSILTSNRISAQNAEMDSILVIPVRYSQFDEDVSVAINSYPVNLITFKAGEKIIIYKADDKKLKGKINKISAAYLIIDSIRVDLNDIKKIYRIRLAYPAYILSLKDFKICQDSTNRENHIFFYGTPSFSERSQQKGCKDSILVLAIKSPGLNTELNVPIEPGPRHYITYAKGNKIFYQKIDGINHKGTIDKVGTDYLIIDSTRIQVNEIVQIGSVRLKYKALILSDKEYQMLRLARYENINNADFQAAEKQKEDNREKRKAINFERRNREYLYPHSLTINIFEPIANQATITYGYRINKNLGIDVSPGFYFQTNKQNATIPHLEYADIHPGFQYEKNRLKGYQLNLGLKIYFNNKPNRYFELLGFERYWHYENEEVLVFFYQDSYQHYAYQTERSWVTGFNILYGWQLTFKNNITSDFFFGLGYYLRRGTITEFSGGYHPGEPLPVVYPYTYHNSAGFFSFQGGVKIGLRFGKRKPAKNDLSFQ